jgi:hypothetical protein
VGYNQDGAQYVIADLKGFTARQVAGLMLNITAYLIEDTPVDTGWARSNWVPSIGEAFADLDGSRKSVSGAAQQGGMLDVAAYDDLAVGDLFITNNVPYILSLNAGHSQQAPAGFVEAAIERGIAGFR